MSRKLQFATPRTSSDARADPPPWTILVVDDDPDVHAITNAVLRDFTFEHRGVRLINANSAAAAREALGEHPDTALILLDVVMENDYAGLHLVRDIRQGLSNRFVQIVLRTGQPGYAPELAVIRDYEINDYREKTELTASKLHTVVMTALRSYRNLMSLERNRVGLAKVVDGTKCLFESRSEQPLIEGVLTQMAALLQLDDEALLIAHAGFAAMHTNGGGYKVLAAVGGVSTGGAPPAAFRPYLDRAVAERHGFFEDDVFVHYVELGEKVQNLLLFQGCRQLSSDSRALIELFAGKVGMALENLALYREIIETDREAISTLSNLAENRSLELGNHIQRIAAFSHYLARVVGLAEGEAELLRRAAAMHDIGKVGIPDAILLKPGPLTEEEWVKMRAHTVIGHQILSGSERPLFRAAAIVAHQHHERYDGSGYPQGLAGEDIHIYGRITAVADVFDALYHERSYKRPWSLPSILDYYREQRGRQFDPRLVDAFIAGIDDILEIDRGIP